MNIVGLGGAGCNLASMFKNYSQYSTFFIDTENCDNHKNFLKIEKQKTHEDYEKNYKKLNLKKIKGETTIIVSGSGKVSGIILRLLEQIKHINPKILYIKPDLSTCDKATKQRERVVFGVLQEYARSNLLSGLFVFSNPLLEGVLEDISIASYWKDINNVICSTYNMLTVFENTEPLLNSLSQQTTTSKIVAPGVVSFKDFSEKMFYDLEKPRLKKYFFGISEKTLNEKKNLLQEIRAYVKNKTSENCSACFAIYTTSYEDDYVYTLHYASMSQEQNIT